MLLIEVKNANGLSVVNPSAAGQFDGVHLPCGVSRVPESVWSLALQYMAEDLGKRVASGEVVVEEVAAEDGLATLHTMAETPAIKMVSRCFDLDQLQAWRGAEDNTHRARLRLVAALDVRIAKLSEKGRMSPARQMWVEQFGTEAERGRRVQ